MQQGYYVFRCESPQAPFDLFAYRDGRSLRVEVKSVTVHDNNKYAPTFAWPVNAEWDLLIVAGHEGRIFEFSAGTATEDARDAVRIGYGFPPMKRKLLPCGTMGAYSRHIAHNEQPCPECREAQREYSRKMKANANTP
jgi:hypothetical protein